MGDKFSALTETGGTPISREGLEMIRLRYHLGAELAQDRRVLEIACGSGVGLGLLSEKARVLAAGDIEPGLLAQARRHYGDRQKLVCFGAHALPFPLSTFDLVLLFESTYYIQDLGAALDEVERVLARRGRLLIVSANPEREDFIRSPFSHRYLTANEFRAALEERGFAVQVQGAFPVDKGSVFSSVATTARKILGRTGLAPRSLRARAILKRLTGGSVVRVPEEISAPPDGDRSLVPVEQGADVSRYKVIYVNGQLRN